MCSDEVIVASSDAWRRGERRLCLKLAQALHSGNVLLLLGLGEFAPDWCKRWSFQMTPRTTTYHSLRTTMFLSLQVAQVLFKALFLL